MTTSKPMHFAMRYSTLCFILTGALILCLCHNGFAKGTGFYQQKPADSIPNKMIGQVKVTVKDLMDGTGLDSVYVLAGSRKGYTDNKGNIVFDSVRAGQMIVASKAGYFAQSKKAKANIQFRLGKRDTRSAVPEYKNGLFARPPEHFSGAATTISGTDLRKINSLSFVEALKYYDPSFIVVRNNNYGDDPNATPSVRIRGSNNFPASATIGSQSGTTATGYQVNPSTGDFIASNIANPNQPVVLINGVQVALQTALDMDINRIAKVTILKDAAAVSAYGVRGGNGVLLIETETPQKGNISINYSGQIQVATPDLSSYQLMNAAEKLQLEQAAGVYVNNAPLYQSRLNQVNKGVNTDWPDIPTRTGVGSKNYLSVEGGDDDFSYGLDASYNNIQGVMKGSERKNANFGSYLSTRIKNLNINNYISYTSSIANNSPYGSFNDYAKQNAYWDPYDSLTGKFSKVLEQYTYQGNVVRFYNPAYNGTLSTTDKTNYSRLSDLLSLNWNIGYGFKANGYLTFNKQSEEENIFLPPGHTSFANYAPENFFQRGKYNQTSSTFISSEGALNLNYSKKIRLHQLYASAGVSAMETRSESAGIEVIGFTSDKLSDLAFGSAYSNKKPQTGMIKTRQASVYGNVTYSYDNRYQLEVTGNADESSQFGKNNLVAPHWSAGASWNLHQERFFHENKILSSLHVRGSVGTAGNLYYQSYLGRTSYNYYTDKQYIQSGSNIGTRGVGLGAFLTGYANDDLKAPETAMQNAGLDAALFQNRLFVTLDVYHNKTKDIVLPVTSPISTGFTNFTYYDNLGSIENKGLSFGLNYRIINNTKRGLIWSAMINGIHNQDRIKTISSYIEAINTSNDGTAADQTRPQPKYVVGQSLTGIWAVRSLGIDPATGQEKFQKADGSETFTWSASDKIFAGDLSPKWLGSFGTTLSVKNISAGIFFNYQFGAKYYNQTFADRIENADLTYNVDKRAANDRWSQPGDKTFFKQLSVNGLTTSPTYATTRFVEKNDFINCSAISLDYTVPGKIIEKIRAKNLRLGLMANNVFKIGKENAERGTYYPFQHMYTFSIAAGF